MANIVDTGCTVACDPWRVVSTTIPGFQYDIPMTSQHQVPSNLRRSLTSIVTLNYMCQTKPLGLALLTLS